MTQKLLNDMEISESEREEIFREWKQRKELQEKLMESSLEYCDQSKSASDNAYGFINRMLKERNETNNSVLMAFVQFYAIYGANNFCFHDLRRKPKSLNRFAEFLVEIHARNHNATYHNNGTLKKMIASCLQNPLIVLSPEANDKIKEIVAEDTGDPIADLQILAYLGQQEVA